MESLLNQISHEATKQGIAKKMEEGSNSDSKVVHFATEEDEVQEILAVIEEDENVDDLEKQQQEDDIESEPNSPSPNVTRRSTRPATRSTKSRRRLARGMFGRSRKAINKDYNVQLVTGLTEPMDPFERRRHEFINPSTAPLLGLLTRQPSTFNLFEDPHYRLSSKAVRNDEERRNDSALSS
jgi:hypothetical protein